ncbi:MAG: DNA-directed RNA polymerase subunit omega [Bacillales bacterium]|jgi:DNA-directed RNA polymerase omega subunit|nr:DNA-directed RNA polymerase subunit omega [Bacillales bacterium]
MKSKINAITPSIDDLIKKTKGNRYILANLAAKRANEIDEFPEEKKKEFLKDSKYGPRKSLGKAFEDIDEGIIELKDK